MGSDLVSREHFPRASSPRHERSRPTAIDEPVARRGVASYLLVGQGSWLVVAVVVAAALTVAGVVAGGQVTVRYTAETRLAVGPDSLKSFSTAGYAEASKTLASNYARYVDQGAEQVAALATAVGAPGLLDEVRASPIPDSNIVRIEVVGESRQATMTAADRVAKGLVDQVNAPPDTTAPLLERLTKVSNELAVVQQRVADAGRDLDQAQDALRTARAAQAAQAALAAQSAQPAVAGQAGTGAQAVQAAQTAVAQQAEAALASVRPAKRRLAAARTALAVKQVQQSTAAQSYQGDLLSITPGKALSVIRVANVVDDSRGASRQWGGIAGLVAGLVLGGLVLLAAGRRRSRRERRPHA